MENKISLRDLAALVEGEIIGDQAIEIHGFGPLDNAGPGEMSFLVKVSHKEALENSSASAFLVPEDFTDSSRTLVRVTDVYLAAALIQNRLLERPFEPQGIHERAYVGDDCTIAELVTISPMAVIGERVSIGERVFIGAGTVIGSDVTIGSDCNIKANVTIEQGCELGDRVVIHPGTVIGSDGYGYAADRRGVHIKRPQLGIVRIGDDVEIGANCCVDRATFGVTWIKSGTKIDNLVQVAHNCVIGENNLLVAQVGIAGSTTCGRNVVFGGQAGSAGHCTIGDGTMVAGMSAVHGDQPPGSLLAGVPAIDAKRWFRASSVIGKLPDISRDLRRLKKEMAKLIEQTESKEG